MLHISLLVKNRLNKTEFAFFISLMRPLLPKDLINQNLFIFVLSFLNKSQRALDLLSGHKIIILGQTNGHIDKQMDGQRTDKVIDIGSPPSSSDEAYKNTHKN